MARPRKDNADYFSHDSNMRSHRKIIALRSKYGLIGYAIYNMLLEHIASCNHFSSKRDEIEQEIIAGDFGITVSDLIDTVSFCHRLDLLQIDGETLKCQSMINRLSHLIEKRDRERNRVSVAETTQPATESPHSIVKYSIVNNRIINNPPEKKSGGNKEYSEEFEMYWKIFPHARKGKKEESYGYFKKLDVDVVMQEIAYLNRCIKFGIQDGNFIPACERWIRDFTQTSPTLRSQNYKTMVFKFMDMPAEERIKIKEELMQMIGEDMFMQYHKERSKQKSGISLILKK